MEISSIRNKLLQQLSSNCRQTTTELAKKLRISRHLVAYHREQLVKQKYIIGYELMLNYQALGYTDYLVYLKVRDYSAIRTKIIDFLKQESNIRWAAETFPVYNLRLAVLSKNHDDLEKILTDLDTICAGRVIEKSVLITTKKLKLESYTTNVSKLIPLGAVKLDAQEQQLILELYGNPIATLKNLAEKSGYSIEGVRQKIKQFVDSGFIQGFSAKIDHAKVGQDFWCNMLIRITNVEKRLRGFQTLLYSDLGYGRTYKTIGNWNVELTIWAKQYKHLTELVKNLEKYFGEDWQNFTFQVYTERIISHKLPILA